MGGGSRTTYSYNYEPDRVKAAEIEKEKAIIIAKLQQENIDKNKQAEFELMQANANFQLDIMKAKEEGFTNVVSALTEMMKEWNILGEQRIAFMNNAKFDVAVKINNLYSELISKVDEDSFEFQLNKIPKMLETSEKLKDPDSRKSYQNSIDKYIASYIEDKKEMTKSYRKQQEILMQSSIDSIDAINSEVTQIVMNRVESMTKTIQGDVDFKQLPNSKKRIEAIKQDNPKLINND
ncbi:MAG: hypothetical protein K9M99_02965 [Candidatus Cloacimonetes bacterium]|nr:hypothetical protein [Candidatus Cloacimonadota bacterium]